jgi:hypothetical protein
MKIKTKRKALYELLKGIFAAARSGQKLPMCTIFLLLHSTLHVLLSLETIHTTFSSIGNIIARNNSKHSTTTFVRQLSYAIIMLNFFINVVGYIFLIRLYKHSIRYIFNREIPPTIMECIPSFCAHLSLLRPLEIIFRYLTYRWRVLPDVIVLGEVRCGTTSLCQHFASLRQRRGRRQHNNNNNNQQRAKTPIIDCHTPFCLWAHPELDHKETFFFVGHYLGYVTPEAYRMCFPLKITRWFNEMKWKLMNRYYEIRIGEQSSTTMQPPLFMTFDGCAQYLTSPTAAALIAEAYRAANEPPPILISCVREPIDQARSWWRYENNAMVWGDSMSLTKYNKELRGDHYPPVTSDDALKFSLNSSTTTKLYKRAEYLFSAQLQNNNNNNNNNTLEEATKRNISVTIPYWAMTWPCGQLSGIGRNALFVENIMRYEKTFQHVFFSRRNNDNNITHHHQQQQQQQQQQNNENENEKKLVYVNIMPMKYLSNETLLKSFLFGILKKVSNRRARHNKENIDPEFENALYRFIYKKNTITTGVHRNAAAAAATAAAATTVRHDENHSYSKEERFSKQSEDFFQVEKQKLLPLCQVNNITWI